MRKTLIAIVSVSALALPAHAANLNTGGLQRMCATGPIDPHNLSAPHAIVSTYASAVADTNAAFAVEGLRGALCLPEEASPEALAIVTCRAALDAPDLGDTDAAYFIGFALAAAYPCDPENHREISRRLFPDMPLIVYD